MTAPTLARWTHRYLRSRQEHGFITAQTASSQRAPLDRFAAAHGHDPVETVDGATLDAWAADLTAHLAPSTAYFHERVVRTFVRWLVDEGVLETNPFRDRRRRRAPIDHPRPLRTSHVEALRGCVRGDARAALMVELGLHGMRCAEVAGLQWHHVTDERTVRFRGKGDRWREVPLADTAVAALERWRAATDTAVPWVFPSPAGGHLIASTVSRLFSQWATAAGIKQAARDGVSMHALRHTCATRLIRTAHADLPLVQDVLGHASLQTTQKYLGRSPMEERRAALVAATGG